MNAEPGYVGIYRDRLIKAGVNEPARWGKLRLATPGLRDFPREHPAHLDLGGDH